MSRPMKSSGVEWIGEIPTDWRLVKYKKFAEIGMGSTLLREDVLMREEIDSVPIYSATQGDKIFGYLKNPKVVLNTNDLVIPARGNSIGYVTMIEEDVATCTQTTIYSKIKGINPKFLFYCANGLREHWFYFVQTAIPQITVSQVQNNLVPVPSPEEQQQIATFLDEKISQIDSIIDNTKQSIAELKKYKQVLITEAVTKGLNTDVKMKNSGIEWIGEIPEHWNVSHLRYLGNLQNGISKSGDAFGSGFPFLSYGDVYRDIELPKSVNGLIESSESERLNYSVTYGDVLFTRTSETIEEVGFSSTCLETIPNVVFAGFVIRFRSMTDELSPRFSKYYFRSQIHRSFFAKEMNLVTRASLSQPLLKKLPVLLTSIEEQQQIADYLDEKCAHIDSLIADKEKLIGEFETYKKALIFEYVTGKKEVE